MTDFQRSLTQAAQQKDADLQARLRPDAP
jgi:hypothetical protein